MMTTTPSHPTPEDFLRLRPQAAAHPPRPLNKRRPVWILGTGQFGRELARVLHTSGFNVAGFVQTHPEAAQVQGLPVLDWHTLALRRTVAQLAVGIFNHRNPWSEVLPLAARAGFLAPFLPWELYEQFAAPLGWRFWLGQRNALLPHLERLAHVADTLADATSRNILLRLCALRLGLNDAFSGYRSPEAHYFNPLTLPPLRGKAVTYIDCGAYNGDTWSELQAQPNITCQQAFLLEPDPHNYAALVQRCSAQPVQHYTPTPICLPVAAAERHGILPFSAGLGEGSTIYTGSSNESSRDNTHTASVALDQLLPHGPAHFIKLDVEGAEALVLQGARRLIVRQRPVLAVSLYHHPCDLWELPERLFGLCEGHYHFYLRQHGYNGFETVLYAIPA